MSKELDYNFPTPEEVEGYVREARRLRAEAFRDMLGLNGKSADKAAKAKPAAKGAAAA